MLVCLCRFIDSDDFESDQELEGRVMEEDFHCGQCQIRYLIGRSRALTEDIDTDE
ncbi:MAG: Uncharacterised protein [Gammaproteobacteria bacterium]|nr:MAG: Uncharacterised protein [Gammaproteobacteria bacterium]